jgi:hypothetical protein
MPKQFTIHQQPGPPLTLEQMAKKYKVSKRRLKEIKQFVARPAKRKRKNAD